MSWPTTWPRPPPHDPAQREHLQRFGAHCLQGSAGARLVLGMDERAMAAANERIVDSLTLNDLEGRSPNSSSGSVTPTAMTHYAWTWSGSGPRPR